MAFSDSLTWACPEQEPDWAISRVQSPGLGRRPFERRFAGAGPASLVVNGTGSVLRTWGKPVGLLRLVWEMKGICDFPLCICMHRDAIKTACGPFHFPAVSGVDQPCCFRWLRVLSLWFVPNAVFPRSSSGHCTVPEEQPVCKKRFSPGPGVGGGGLCHAFPSCVHIWMDSACLFELSKTGACSSCLLRENLSLPSSVYSFRDMRVSPGGLGRGRQISDSSETHGSGVCWGEGRSAQRFSSKRGPSPDSPTSWGC